MAEEQHPEASASPKPAKRRNARAKNATKTEAVVIAAGNAGEWLPVEELRGKALKALEENRSVTLDLEGVDHLDASALQILLALHAEQQARGARLDFQNASPALCQWVQCAGAADYLSLV